MCRMGHAARRLWSWLIFDVGQAMNFFRYPREYFRRNTPAEGFIKKKAHAATLAVCALIVPSLCAIYFRHAGIKENEPYWVWASETVWKIHAAFVAVAVFFWIFEKPRLTRYVPSEPTEEDQDPERARANNRWKREDFVATVSILCILCLLSFWATYEAIDRVRVNWGWRPARAIGSGIGAVIMFYVSTFGVRVLLLVVKHRPRDAARR